MSSLYKENDRGTIAWRLRFFLGGKRLSMRLGLISKRSAEEVARHVNSLIRTHELGLPIETETHKWLVDVDAKIYDKFVAWGLCEARGTTVSKDATKFLGPFIDAFLETAANDNVSASYLSNYKQTRRVAVEKFGERRALRSITPADAEQWRLWMLSRPLAVATVSKHVKRMKTMMKSAVGSHFIASNPFQDVKGGSEVNKSRFHYVDRETAEKVIAACPDHDWKLIFALPRFAGLRCPSEVTSLEWSDILWDEKRIRINSSKTGLRHCPLFPELATLLREAQNADFAHPVYCVANHRGNKNFGTQLKRILNQAGVKPWPKTFVNLRSSRRTELQDQFPSHVINEWLGHSTAVAESHYLQVTAGHWERATAEHEAQKPKPKRRPKK